MAEALPSRIAEFLNETSWDRAVMETHEHLAVAEGLLREALDALRAPVPAAPGETLTNRNALRAARLAIENARGRSYYMHPVTHRMLMEDLSDALSALDLLAAPTVPPETPQAPDAWIVEYRWTKGDPPEWRRVWADAARTTTFFADRDEAQRAADARIEDGHDTRIVLVFRRPS